MRKQTLCIFLILIPVFFGNVLKGQTAVQASTTAHVFARVFEATTSVKTSHDSFGHFYPLSYDGQLINGPDGILSVRGNIDEGGEIQYTTSYDVSSSSNTAFAISLPRTITLKNTMDSKTMTLNDWRYVSMNASEEGEIPFGYKKVNLNAILNLRSSKDNPVGFYTGYYTVTFGFN